MDLVAPTLLLIPPLKQTESLRAFMYRAAEVNAFPRMYAGSAHTLKHAGRLLSQVEGQDPPLGQELRLRLAPTPITKHKAREFLLGEEKIPSSYLRIDARSVCPLCLTKDLWSRSEWELKAYTTCHLHGVSLVNKCDQCHQKLSWSRTEISRCYCGRAFSSMSPASSKDWERKWAKQVHLAFSHSMSGTSKKFASGTKLSRLLLLIDVVRAVIVPSGVFRKRFNDGPAQLVAKMLMAQGYRSCLWESIFLYVAETPMSLSEKLSLGQTNDDLVRNYQRFAEVAPIPLELKPKIPPLERGSCSSPPRFSAVTDMRSYVARLKHLYGARSGNPPNFH